MYDSINNFYLNFEIVILLSALFTLLTFFLLCLLLLKCIIWIFNHYKKIIKFIKNHNITISVLSFIFIVLLSFAFYFYNILYKYEICIECDKKTITGIEINCSFEEFCKRYPHLRPELSDGFYTWGDEIGNAEQHQIYKSFLTYRIDDLISKTWNYGPPLPYIKGDINGVLINDFGKRFKKGFYLINIHKKMSCDTLFLDIKENNFTIAVPIIQDSQFSYEIISISDKRVYKITHNKMFIELDFGTYDLYVDGEHYYRIVVKTIK